MKKISEPYITFRGVRCDEVGARLAEAPVITYGIPKGKKVEIPGRDGTLFISDGGYNATTIKLTFVVPNADDLTTVANWLSGYGKLVIGDQPEQYYKGLVITAGQVTNVAPRLDGKRIVATFTCEPFRYSTFEIPYQLSGASGEKSVDGKGNYYARPIITVHAAAPRGSGSNIRYASVEIEINDWTIEMESIDTYVTLDCEAMMAYKGGSNKSRYVTITTDNDDDWPMLYPDGQANTITWTNKGGSSYPAVTGIELWPNWRWR